MQEINRLNPPVLTTCINKVVKLDLKLFMRRPSLCDYSDAFIFVSRTVIITGEGADDTAKHQEKKGVKLIKSAPFIKCKSGKNNTLINYVKDLNFLMSMYKLIV